jgi:hypothetical protein
VRGHRSREPPLSPSAVSLAACGELPEPLRRLAGYRPSMPEYGRLETEVREPRNACQLGCPVVGDHPRRTANPPVAPTTGSITRKEHAPVAIEEKGCVPAGVAGGYGSP